MHCHAFLQGIFLTQGSVSLMFPALAGSTGEAQNPFVYVISVNLEAMVVNYFSCFVSGNRDSQRMSK